MHDDLPQLLASFAGREEELRRLTRYSLYSRMAYRTNLWNHSRRVRWLTEEIIPFLASPALDARRASLLALVHDDAELVTGDIQAAHKSVMSASQLKEIDDEEERAIETLAGRFPAQVGGYSYPGLLREILHRTTLESQAVVLADKMDGFMEAVHELYAGNRTFATRVTDKLGRLPLPHEYYLNYFAGLTKRFPALLPLTQTDCWLAQPLGDPGFEAIAAAGSPHTPQSLARPKGYLPYDRWVALMRRRSTPAEFSELYRASE